MGTGGLGAAVSGVLTRTESREIGFLEGMGAD
jgi:hypothetical protein